jgi:hypothetical protein
MNSTARAARLKSQVRRFYFHSPRYRHPGNASGVIRDLLKILMPFIEKTADGLRFPG